MLQDQLRFDSTSSFTRTALPVVLATLAALGCTTTNEIIPHYHYLDAGTLPDPGTPDPIIKHVPWPVAGSSSGGAPETGGGGSSSGAGGANGGSSDAGPEPAFPGAPIANTAPDDLNLDIYGTIANRYWFVVNDEQLAIMNSRQSYNEDIYAPLGAEAPTFVDHLLATPAGSTETADYGKVQVSLIGQSTYRPWDADNIPNLKVDADEFIDGNKIGSAKHVRFNNAIAGGVFIEKFIFDVFKRLDYPAPRATHGWVSSNVWGPEISIPYVVVESYKPQFCTLREDELGGGCENMWEGYGSFGDFDFSSPENCQFSECESDHARDFQDEVLATSWGPGFKEALDPWIEWDAFHQFQCLIWMLDIGDDALHSQNNIVIAERADGKFQYLPYSVDLSMNYGVSLGAESNEIAQGCQADPDCWADTIATCEGLIQDFEELDPVAMLDDLYTQLDEEGMLRRGDERRYEQMSNYLEQRLEQLPVQLELNRDEPYFPIWCGYQPGLVDCGGYCGFPEECGYCEEPGGGGGGDPGGCMGLPNGIIICQGGGGMVPGGAVAPAARIAPEPGADSGPGGGGDAGEDPVECIPYVDLY